MNQIYHFSPFLEINILLTSISFVLNIFCFCCKSNFFSFFCRQNLCYFHSFLYSVKKINIWFYNNLGTPIDIMHIYLFLQCFFMIKDYQNGYTFEWGFLILLKIYVSVYYVCENILFQIDLAKKVLYKNVLFISLYTFLISFFLLKS